MDQYPYSIPPGFHPYAGNGSEKSTDVPIGSGVPSQNPYFVHSSGPAEVPPFGYVPPTAAASLEQQVSQPNSVPIPAVQANGLMPPGGPAGYNAFNNAATYGVQFPVAADAAPMPHMAGIEGMFDQPNFNPQVTANTAAILYQPVPTVVKPTESDNTLGTFESNVAGNAIASEALNVAQDNNTETNVNKEAEAKEHETVVEDIHESNRESTPLAEATVAESTTPLPTDADPSKPSEEPQQTSLSTDPNEPSSIGNDLPASNEVPDAPHEQQPAETSEEPVDLPKSRSPSRSRSLSASTEDVSTVSVPKKKRRRIVTLNDDEDDSEDEDISNRMELLRSPEPESATVGNDADESVGESNRRSNERDGLGDSEKEDDDVRPMSSASGTASIFQNVVMIPAGGDSEAHKRKKIRVLDSDDDEDDQKALVSVDDIGLTGEGADDLNPGGLLVDENAEDEDLGMVDGIELDKMEQIVAMDAPIIDPSELANEEDDDGGSEAGDNGNEKDTSDREQNGSEGEEDEQEQDNEEFVEEEEVVEEGVEMIAAEDDDGEAIGIATDDEQELEENVEPEAASDAEGSEAVASDAAGSEGSEVEDNRGSGAEDEQASDAERSDAEEQIGNERRQSVSERGDKDESEEQEEEDGQNDQSDTRSTSTPAERENDSGSEKQRKDKDEAKKSDSDDDVVCQNDLELNTISLLTDEEDDNMTPLPPPKKELPVVRIVNIKKELLDERFTRRDTAVPRMDAATSYQQQHYLKRQQQLAQKKREKAKKRSERTFDNNNPFGPWSSSSSDDEFIPNDIYFGTPDRVFTASTKVRCQRQKMINDRYSKQSRPYKKKYGEQPDAEQRRKQKQKLEQISRLNLPTYQQQQLQTLVKKKKKSTADRFYDKSQDIPNDIYFGNVNVPLHILHAFGDSSSDEERRAGNVWRASLPMRGSTSTSTRGAKHQSSSKSYKKASSSSTHRSPHSPSNDRSIQAMKEYLKIAGFKNVKFHKLWEGCKSNQERANAILRLMQEKGLEGEPTIAKCRELRKQLQMEREVQVLDTSLIIDSTEGRTTRRSARHQQNQISPGLPADPNAPSTSGLSQPPANVPPESLETLNRMRSVIDPDSDGEE